MNAFVPSGKLPLILAALALLPLRALATDDAQLSIPDNPLEGRLLFEKYDCQECHGIAGEAAGPSFADGGFQGSLFDLGAALWNHVPGMSVEHETSGRPWPELEPSETVRLLAFLYSIDYLGRPGDAPRGREIFTTKGCSVCHSLGSTRGGSVGPDLSELTRFASPLYIAQAIWNHGPSMLESMEDMNMKPPSFDDGDLSDLSAFLRQQAGDGPKERMLLAPGNPNHGRQLFATKGCGSCHGNARSASGDAPSLAASDLHRSADGVAGTMWNHALSMSESMQRRGIDWPSLTTKELADLIAYLYFLPFEDPAGNAASGALLFESRSCSACHGAESDSPHAAADLTRGEITTSPAAFVTAMWNHAPIMKEVILGEGRPWPILTGEDLRNLLAYLRAQ